MANTDKSKEYYRLVYTNWTKKETFNGKIIEQGAIISVSPKDLKDEGLKRRLAQFFVKLTKEEAKAHEGVLGTEKIESGPIEIIDDNQQ